MAGKRENSRMRAGVRYGILGGTFDPPHIGHLALAQEAHARLALDRVWFAPAASPPHKQGHALSSAAHRRAMVELAIADDDRFGLDTVDLDRPGPAYTAETLRQLRERWGAATWIGFIVGWDMLLSLPTWHEPLAALAALDALIAARRPGYASERATGDAEGDAESDSDSDESAEAALADLERRLPGLRAKLAILPGPQLDIAASDLRARVAQGLPVRYLTPDPVRAYISAHRLYSRR